MAKTFRPGPKTLRVLRAEREITQAAIATRAGLTQTRYWQIEHGEGAPLRTTERLAIARILELSPRAIAWPAKTLTPLQATRARAQEERRRAAADLAEECR